MSKSAATSLALAADLPSKKPPRSWSQDRGDTEAVEGSAENFLALYFREMASLSMLKPEEEFDTARKIEAVELELWTHLLSHPRLAELVLRQVERQIEACADDVESLRCAARKLQASAPAKARQRYLLQCSKAAARFYPADVDRRALLLILADLHQLARGERPPKSLQLGKLSLTSKAFKAYWRGAGLLFRAAQAARNDFVRANLRLVVSIARRFNYGRMPLNDLIQEGNIGLIKAVERYDYRRGYRFSTYASWWIRHAISRALADKGRAVRLPVHMLDAHHKVSRTFRELSTRLGRAPTAEEIGAAAGMSVEKVERIQGYMLDQSLSLDRSISEEDGRRFVELLTDPEVPSAVEVLSEQALNEQVHEIISHLKPIEADVLRRRFGLLGEQEHTLKEIGESYHLSRERIRQIQEQALGKIRRALELRRVV
jgi:RNA polymerase primary sigma factor